MDRMQEVMRAVRCAQDAELSARGYSDGLADGLAAGESEGWEAGNDVAMTGMARQER